MFFNYYNHEDIPEVLQEYVVSALVFSGYEISSITEVSVADINGFLNMNEEMDEMQEVYEMGKEAAFNEILRAATQKDPC